MPLSPSMRPYWLPVAAAHYELMQPFGVDLTDPRFWQGGLATIDHLLTQVEEPHDR